MKVNRTNAQNCSYHTRFLEQLMVANYFSISLLSFLNSAETWTIRAVDRKYLESFEMLEKDGEDQLDRSCEKCRST
jgi:hypothetical protein